MLHTMARKVDIRRALAGLGGGSLRTGQFPSFLDLFVQGSAAGVRKVTQDSRSCWDLEHREAFREKSAGLSAMLPIPQYVRQLSRVQEFGRLKRPPVWMGPSAKNGESRHKMRYAYPA